MRRATVRYAIDRGRVKSPVVAALDETNDGAEWRMCARSVTDFPLDLDQSDSLSHMTVRIGLSYPRIIDTLPLSIHIYLFIFSLHLISIRVSRKNGLFNRNSIVAVENKPTPALYTQRVTTNTTAGPDFNHHHHHHHHHHQRQSVVGRRPVD